MNALLRGLASLFDSSGSLARQRAEEILSRSDADAIRADWQAVAGDMWRAFDQVRAEDIPDTDYPAAARHIARVMGRSR